LFFILLEFLNNKVQSKEDIENISDIPFAGVIGHKRISHNLVVNEMPKSAIAESFRSLRSNLNFFTGNKDKKIILVTSSVSGEGKTFTAINLATVFALSGKKTLIVGADMRKPKVFRDLKLSNDVGFSNYLSGDLSLNDITQEVNIQNMTLISAGPVPPNPSELLLNTNIEHFMDQTRKEFDIVILDTPPLNIVTDAFLLSKFADHTVFITRQNYTPLAALRNINELYAEKKLTNVSILLNDMQNVRPGYGNNYGYGTGYGYGYGYNYATGYGYENSQNGSGYYTDDETKSSKKSLLKRFFSLF